jgi:DNA anti-recombination protein RmuC
MDHQQHLGLLLDQWLALTRAEASALDAGDWLSFKRLQTEKTSLRQGLDQVVNDCRARGLNFSEQIRSKVGRIESLLTRNGSRLETRRKALRRSQDALDQVRRNLHRIRSSYAQPAGRALWNSYS